MVTRYENCDICGYQYPIGHPCLNCNSKGLKGTKIDPETIGTFVNILRLRADDILVCKLDLAKMSDEHKRSHIEFLEELPLIRKKRIKIMLIDNDDEIVVLRKEDK